MIVLNLNFIKWYQKYTRIYAILNPLTLNIARVNLKWPIAGRAGFNILKFCLHQGETIIDLVHLPE